MLKYIVLGLLVPLIAFFIMYRWDQLKANSKRITLSTGISIFIIGILILIALLID